MGLDRERDLAVLAIDAGHASVQPVADGEPVGALLAALTGKIGPADKARQPIPDGNLKPAIDHVGNRAGHGIAALDAVHRIFERIVIELLDAQADAFLAGIDIENLDLDQIAFVEIFDGVVSR